MCAKFFLAEPLQKPTFGIHNMERGDVYRQPTESVVRHIVPRAKWHCSGDRSATNNPLGAPGSTLLFLCLPPIRGSAGGDYYLLFSYL